MKILDLYCGAGLAAIGYKQAGFNVTGVDNEQKSCYAGDEFIMADVFDILKDIAFCRQFDAIHASPPCQKYSQSTALHRANGAVYPDLIELTRRWLDHIDLPYVIENVSAAPVRPDVVLYGHMFGLKVIRKRKFELGNWFMMQPVVPIVGGQVKTGDFCCVMGKGSYRANSSTPKGHRPKFDQGSINSTWAYAMGLPPGLKFKNTEIAEGIPPAYTKYIGSHLIEFLTINKAK